MPRTDLEVRLTGDDLMTEFLDAIAGQRREDGTYITPHPAEKRSRILNAHWRGTEIAAKVLQGGAARITRAGYHDGQGESIQFPVAQGEIERMSPAYGGSIELTDGACIALGMPSSDRKGPIRPDFNPGLEITIIEQ